MKKLAVFLLVAFVLGVGVVSASSATLSGWAWSETFGWISFNSADAGAGGGPYAVSVDGAGDWSGYAWSEYLGWISFNVADGLKCNASAQVHLNTTTGAVTGWAYAMLYNPTAEGCIEISGATHNVSYSPSTGKFTGYAWGGDTTGGTGPGWIQFDTSPAGTTGVNCQSVGCGYTGGGITGTCTATPPYQNVPPGTVVTFVANATSGTGPYHYQWNGEVGWDTQPSPFFDRTSVSYSATGAGPTVVIKDNAGLLTSSISCPTVTVTTPIGASSLMVGRTVALATTNPFTLKANSPFALVWDLTLSDDYSCVPIVSPDPLNANWNTGWKGASLGTINNGDGTKTWRGDSGTNLTAGSVSNPVAPGIYSFQIACTSATSATQSVGATLRVNSSTGGEI